MLILFLLFLIQFSIACACLAVNTKQQEQLAEQVISCLKQRSVLHRFEMNKIKYIGGILELDSQPRSEASFLSLTIEHTHSLSFDIQIVLELKIKKNSLDWGLDIRAVL